MGLFDETPKTVGFQENAAEERQSIFDSGWSSSSSESEQVQLSKFSVPALLVLIVGILSLLTFVYPTFIFAGWIALLGGIATLIAIRRSSVSVTGNGMALIGACLAIVSLIVPALGQATYERAKILEGEQFAARFFDLIAQGKTYDLMQAKKYAPERNPASDEVAFWKSQMKDSKTHIALHTGFLSDPVLLLLYHLREQVKYTYIRTYSIENPDPGVEIYSLIYAATFNNAQGEKESILFKIQLAHSWNGKDRAGYWQVTKTPMLLSKDEIASLQI